MSYVEDANWNCKVQRKQKLKCYARKSVTPKTQTSCTYIITNTQKLWQPDTGREKTICKKVVNDSKEKIKNKNS